MLFWESDMHTDHGILMNVSENDQLLVWVAIVSWNSCCVNIGGLTVPRSSVGGSFMVNCAIRPYYIPHILLVWASSTMRNLSQHLTYYNEITPSYCLSELHGMRHLSQPLGHILYGMTWMWYLLWWLYRPHLGKTAWSCGLTIPRIIPLHVSTSCIVRWFLLASFL